MPGSVHAGERWRMTVRLKAPHGNLNPHGFDQELRLWEQDVQASGYVRTGARDTRPQALGQTWRHPVERARERSWIGGIDAPGAVVVRDCLEVVEAGQHGSG